MHTRRVSDVDNSSCDEGCGPNEPGPSGCDNQCGSTLVEDECGICGGNNEALDCTGTCFGDSFLDCNGQCCDPSTQELCAFEDECTGTCTIKDATGKWRGHHCVWGNYIGVPPTPTLNYTSHCGWKGCFGNDASCSPANVMNFNPCNFCIGINKNGPVSIALHDGNTFTYANNGGPGGGWGMYTTSAAINGAATAQGISGFDVDTRGYCSHCGDGCTPIGGECLGRNWYSGECFDE